MNRRTRIYQIARAIALMRIATPSMIAAMVRCRMAAVNAGLAWLSQQRCISYRTIPERDRWEARTWIGDDTVMVIALPNVLEFVYGTRDDTWDHDQLWIDTEGGSLRHTLAVSAWIGATIRAIETNRAWHLRRVDRERIIWLDESQHPTRFLTGDHRDDTFRPDAIIWFHTNTADDIGIASEIDLGSEGRGTWERKIRRYHRWLRGYSRYHRTPIIVPVVVTRTISRWYTIARWWQAIDSRWPWGPWGATIHLAIDRDPPQYHHAAASPDLLVSLPDLLEHVAQGHMTVIPQKHEH